MLDENLAPRFIIFRWGRTPLSLSLSLEQIFDLHLFPVFYISYMDVCCPPAALDLGSWVARGGGVVEFLLVCLADFPALINTMTVSTSLRRSLFVLRARRPLSV